MRHRQNRPGPAKWKVGCGCLGALFILMLGIGACESALEGSDNPKKPDPTVTVTDTPTATVTKTAKPTHKATPKVTPTQTTHTPKPVHTYTPTPKAVPTTTTPAARYYANCAAVRAAGAAPLLAGQPGYRSGLDRDGDGSACDVG